MEAINGFTILFVVIIITMYIHFKGKIATLTKDIGYWKEGYTEVNTKLRKAEKILIELEKKNGQ